MAAQGYTGKTVIVVDADSPFGSATVDLVMSKGANVVANSPRDRTYQEPEPTHKGRLLRTQVQAASAATIAQRALSHFGHIDVVINNVEVGHSGSFRDGAEPDWRENVLEALKRAFKVRASNLAGPGQVWLTQGSIGYASRVPTFQTASRRQNHQRLHGSRAARLSL